LYQDQRGVPLTVSSAGAAAAFDSAMDGYIRNRADLPARMNALMQAAPDFALAHCMKAYLSMLSFRLDTIPAARQAAQEAERLAHGASRREQMHVAAVKAWIEGEPPRAAAIWNEILHGHPRDILAFRLAHFVNFWQGRPDLMLASVQSTEPHWSPELPGYTSLLACRCFANEECGNYLEAEAAGRDAIARDPADLWAAHGVAHVLEMQGRRGEGIAWLESLQPHWDGGNNLKHHLWWHAAMYHLERGDHEAVLRLYDQGFRDLESPLTQANPQLYIDVQNAASMLWRLARRGVDAGDRWIELADKAEQNTEDCLSAFTMPHWMMALAATGRASAAQRMLKGMRDYAQAPHSQARLIADVALPVTEAVWAHGCGEFARAVALMRPVLQSMYRLGGSHAQQDVLEQLFLDAALKSGNDADARMLLERVAGQHPVPPARRAGYAMAAHLLN
jgi:tetratricopeptide (TPR) repeat protein